MDGYQQALLELPIGPVIPRLITALRQGHAVLTAPTGSGKTTVVPLALSDEEWLTGKKILMLEPRRIAARAAALRMSFLVNEPVGGRIGYRTRYETQVSPTSRIEVLTEGILIRRLQHDPELTQVGLIIFDEFHERSIQADLGLALCLDLCQLRPDLRLLVMSATLASEALARLLGDAPVITGTGRSYPVSVSYLPPATPANGQGSIANQTSQGVLHAWHRQEGDILAFLPGTGEIRHCRSVLSDQLPEAQILPLYGNLSQAEQDLVFRRTDQRRRIILATPVAETSITLEGIGCVVDSGFCRRPHYNATSGLTTLALTRISRASADQRSGRAGRLGPGTCYRLWSANTDYSLPTETPPEILQADLSSLVLELALWGVRDPNQLAWLDPPRPTSWDQAVRLLEELTLLDGHGHITACGRQVVALPLHPRLGYMLVRAKEHRLARTAALLAALLDERDIIGQAPAPTVDIGERMRLLLAFEQNRPALPPYLDRGLCRRLLGQVQQWLRILSCPKEEAVNLGEVGRLLAYAYPDRIAQIRPGSRHRYQLAGGRGAELPAADPLGGQRLLVAPQVDARPGDGRIFLAAVVELEALRLSQPQLFREDDLIAWDDEQKRVHCRRELRLDQLIITSTTRPPSASEEVRAAFLEGVQKNSASLPWTKEARQLQARISSLAFWQDGQWPDCSDATLAENLDWLAPYCLNLHRLDQLQTLNLAAILLSRLTWQQQAQLDRLAPTHLRVPSGSSIRLQYQPGQPPILAVRLQEVFGLADSPMVCDGRIRVLLHLLSPAGRPVQVTADLQSFWQTTYGEVRRELAGRYPKHFWPLNPLGAEATARTKKSKPAPDR